MTFRKFGENLMSIMRTPGPHKYKATPIRLLSNVMGLNWFVGGHIKTYTYIHIRTRAGVITTIMLHDRCHMSIIKKLAQEGVAVQTDVSILVISSCQRFVW